MRTGMTPRKAIQLAVSVIRAPVPAFLPSFPPQTLPIARFKKVFRHGPPPVERHSHAGGPEVKQVAKGVYVNDPLQQARELGVKPGMVAAWRDLNSSDMFLGGNFGEVGG